MYRGWLSSSNASAPSSFELTSYSMAPASGFFAFAVAFIEVDAMMTREGFVLREHILDAVTKARAR